MTESSRAVFLSYASQDAEAAQRICESLRAAGIEVWFDQSELRGGDAWDAAIRKQIKACGLFIPIISANSDARTEGYFRLEWKLAVDRSHLMASDRAFLLPVVIDNLAESDARVPGRFRELQWTTVPEGKAPQELVDTVRRLLETTAAGRSGSPQPSQLSSLRCGPRAQTPAKRACLCLDEREIPRRSHDSLAGPLSGPQRRVGWLALVPARERSVQTSS